MMKISVPMTQMKLYYKDPQNIEIQLIPGHAMPS